jgi:hypothetical protein
MRHIKQSMALSIDPLLLRKRLTLRAMPIAARVIGRVLVAAGRTSIEMAAEGGGTATNNVSQHSALSRAEANGLLQCHSVLPDDIGKVEA